jgi:hypothetical protein
MPMSDRQLARHAMKLQGGRDDEKAGKQIKDDETSVVLAELARRGTRKLTTALGANEITITGVIPTDTVYDWDALAERLTVRQMRAIQKEEVDPQKLAELVQEGKIDSAVVAACSTVKEKSGYVLVSVKSRSE